jgi:hypothetical protein
MPILNCIIYQPFFARFFCCRFTLNIIVHDYTFVVTNDRNINRVSTFQVYPISTLFYHQLLEKQ